MDEYKVLVANHFYVTNHNSLAALAISIIAGFAVMWLMDKPRLLRFRVQVMLITMLAINITGFELDRRERIAQGTPYCQATIQSPSGEKTTLKYKTSSTQECLKTGTVVNRIVFDETSSFPKGTLYIERGFGKGGVFIQ